MRQFRQIVSFDLAVANTGYCLWSSEIELADGFSFSLQKSPYADVVRMADVLKKVKTVTMSGDGSPVNTLVVLEGFAYGRPELACETGGLGYLIRFWLWQNDYEYVLVPPSTLKKFTCGVGNAKKELMLQATLRQGWCDTDNNNIADAVALSYVGRAMIGAWEPKRDEQRKIAADLRKKNSHLWEEKF